MYLQYTTIHPYTGVIMTIPYQRSTFFTLSFSFLFLFLLTGCGEDPPVQPDENNSPGNGKIYATRITNSSYALLRLNADGTEQQTIQQEVGILSAPQAGKMLTVTPPNILTLADLEGNSIRTIPTVGTPKVAILSPDGNTICYAYYDYLNSTRQLYTIRTVRADGTGDVLLTTQGGWENTVTFSPDSKRVAFYLDEVAGSPDKLYTINIDGTDRKLVTENARSINDRFGGVAWSANEDRILFSRQGSNYEWQIWSIKADGSDERQITDASLPNGLSPTFSPDGTMIAFSGSMRDEEADLWVMNSDGSNKRKLTDTPGSDDLEVFPQWSPDGKSILCVSFAIPEQGDPSTGKVKTVDVATGAAKFIIETPDIHGAYWGKK